MNFSTSAPGGFSIAFTLVAVIVIGVFAYAVVKGLMTWMRNNNSPRLTVSATAVTKREHVSVSGGGARTSHMHTSVSSTTRYYVTFQLENGDRIELGVRSTEYGMIAEGDRGQLTYQGTRYLGFERERN